MASLQQSKDRFCVSFRFGGQRFRRSLETINIDEAEPARMQVELTRYRIKTGVLPSLPDEADAALDIISRGNSSSGEIMELAPAPQADLQVSHWDLESLNFKFLRVSSKTNCWLL